MKAPKALLTWKVVHERMPWNIILLLGGGFALAAGSEVTTKCSLLLLFNYLKHQFITQEPLSKRVYKINLASIVSPKTIQMQGTSMERRVNLLMI